MAHPDPNRRAPKTLTLGLLSPLALLLALLSPSTLAEEIPQIEIDGGTSEQRQNIRAFLPMNRFDCELPSFRERNVVDGTKERVRQALRALGHYQPEIAIEISRTETCWNLVVTIDPGPVARIVGIDVRVSGEGEEDPSFVAVTSDPGIEPGDALRHDSFDGLRTRLVRIAADRGYFDAELTESRLLVDPARNEARISLHLESGRRYRMGEVTLEQNILNDDFVARLIPFERGAPYSSAHLIRLQRNLNDSGYFQAVRVRPRLDDAVDGKVPILAEVEPRKRTAYEARLGFSTDLGPRVGLVLDRRYANQYGHRYNAELESSQKRSGVSFSYDVPLADPLNDTLSFLASYRNEDTGTSDSERFQLGASRLQRHASGWQTAQGIRYERERFTVGDATDTTDLLIPSYRISRTESDDPLFPTNGYRLEWLAQAASENLGSSVTFLQTRANAKFITGLGPGRLILRSEAGLTGGAKVDELPSSLRFFAGGDTSVRGFGFQQLGPSDNDGNAIGGRHVLVGSAEYDYPIGQGPWGVAVFLDAGDAFNDFGDYDLKVGIGAGVRWRSPVGPIRIDLAHAPDSKDSFRIHFTMGPDL